MKVNDRHVSFYYENDNGYGEIEIDPKKAALLVIDMQHVLDYYRTHGMEVIFAKIEVKYLSKGSIFKLAAKSQPGPGGIFLFVELAEAAVYFSSKDILVN